MAIHAFKWPIDDTTFEIGKWLCAYVSLQSVKRELENIFQNLKTELKGFVNIKFSNVFPAKNACFGVLYCTACSIHQTVLFYRVLGFVFQCSSTF